MKGGIYSDQTCPICGSRFEDNKRNALICPCDPEQHATHFRVYFKSVSKRFSSYDEAQRFLTGLRYETDKGTFDQREYRKDLPLSFQNLALQWLQIKKNGNIKPGTFRDLHCHINKAIDFFQDKNVKEFKPKDFEQFMISLEGLSSKTKHNSLSILHQFFRWLFDNDEIEKIPKFPKQRFSLARRNTIDKETQDKILDEVYAISKIVNIKIWIGIKFLSTYFNTRPGELLQIKEKDIDLQQGKILVSETKEGNPKMIFLLDEDIELLKSFPQGIGELYQELYFFRHRKGMKGIREGQKFGNHIFYSFWKKACSNLHIDNVDLYGGTRHSSVQALREDLSPEQIRLASGHTTNKAFERYYKLSKVELVKTYSLTRKNQGGKGLAKNLKNVSC
jgi:integrase